MLTKTSKLLALAALVIVLPIAGAHASTMTHKVSFSKLDKDKNHQVSESEFTSVYKTADADATFKKLDVNGDGSLSKEELSKINAPAKAAAVKTETTAKTK